MSQTSPDGLEGSEFVPEEVSRSENVPVGTFIGFRERNSAQLKQQFEEMFLQEHCGKLAVGEVGS